MTHPRSRPLLLTATVVTTLAARGFWGCASDAPPGPGIETEGGTITPVDAGRDTSKPEVEAAPPEPEPPEGWVPWNDFSPTCSLYVPPRRDLLPPPLEWEPCLDSPVTQKLACRRIKKKWEGGSGSTRGEFLSPITSTMIREDGSVLISTTQYWGTRRMNIFAELDGAVKVAVYEHRTDNCLLFSGSGSGSHYIFHVNERSSAGRMVGDVSAIGGNIDELVPKALIRTPVNEVEHTLRAGNAGFFDDIGGITLYRWDAPTTPVRIAPGGDYYLVRPWGDMAHWSVGESVADMIWTPEGGAQPFVTFPDRTRGAGSLGTDGVHWVWVEGEGRTTVTYPRVSLMVAPFTRDPSTLQKRKLRGDLDSLPFGTAKFVVGHGFAARAMDRKDDAGVLKTGMLVARLSDGVAYYLPSDRVELGYALAMTKDEVIVRGRDKDGTNVFRIRLDSLGAFELPPP
ncbi:MAG: hypothetical protein U0183_31785 [Polyangiaceae bacterium]